GKVKRSAPFFRMRLLVVCPDRNLRISVFEVSSRRDFFVMPIDRRTRALDHASFGTPVKSSSSPVAKIANRGGLGTRAFGRVRGLGRGHRHGRFTDLKG